MLDRRISLVRREVLGTPLPTLEPSARPQRMAILLANVNSPAYRTLDLQTERQNIADVLKNVPNLQPNFFPDATVDSVEEAADWDPLIFHFSGHGEFHGNIAGLYGSLDGEGVIVLRDAAGEPAFFPATKLAATLANHGIRLVVLGACEGGRRNTISAWTGVVPTLTHVGIPAIIGMQFTVQDASAILFSKAFYRSLSAGKGIDEAADRSTARHLHPREGRTSAIGACRCSICAPRRRTWRSSHERDAASEVQPTPAPTVTAPPSAQPVPGETATHKARVLAELLQPILIQLDRTQAAFSRWTGKNLYLEAKIIREGNLAVRDLLISKAELIPTDLVSHANKLIVHYDRWLEEFDRLPRGQPAARR